MADSTSPAAPRALDDLFDTSTILPTAPLGDDGEPLEVLHDREYRVRAFRKRDDLLLIRGAVRDQKPPGLYIDIDPDPMTIHHMQIDLEIAFPTLEIVGAQVGIEVHPSAGCPSIESHYDKLVGLSIARGFTHKVRELFGGPRGCTHTTALLQAMAPVAVQCMWSMRASQARRSGGTAQEPSPEQREMAWQFNLNTCHVWAEDGEQVRAAPGRWRLRAADLGERANGGTRTQARCVAPADAVLTAPIESLVANRVRPGRLSDHMVVIAQQVEHQVVILAVGGSSPLGHPIRRP